MLDVVRFGQTTLDLRARTLRRGGRLVALQSRPFDLLALLVGHADSTLTREAIQDAIWPDVVVEYDQNINFAVRQIRLALGSDADRLQTVPRRGYRFAGPIRRPSLWRWTALRTAALAAAFAAIFGAGIVTAHTASGAFIYEHLAHPDHCPYLQFLFGHGRSS